MFLYEKKIVYLSLFLDGVKNGNAGFVRISRDADALIMDIHVKSENIGDSVYGLFLTAQSRQIQWGNVSIKDGKGETKRTVMIREGYARFGEEEFAEDALCGILISIGKESWIAGRWRETQNGEAMERHSNPDAVCEKEREEEAACREELNVAEKEEPPEPMAENKWEQLQRCYKKVHPFGDERLFLSIEPKDFVVLQAPYHRLVNNSFLLHGFYNYRHMILGPDREIGKETGTCFYLGVPGTYFEREKMVAIMFGFEGFECDGAVEIGKFGYYMRRVEI